MNTMTEQQNHVDSLNRFLFDNHPVRGEYVKLSETYQTMLTGHHYPPAVQKLLGELLVVTSLLTATLKFEGEITVQLQGDGPLKLAVINGDNQQNLRGVARVTGTINEHASLKEMIGNGILVITITPKQGERYQGIVGLEADTISACIENYFARSEQLPTRLFIFTGSQQGQAIAAGILLQILPSQEVALDSFEHLSTLTQTVSALELFNLAPAELLYRLFHQEEVRLFAPQPVSFKCTCSQQRCADSLMTLPASEIDTMLAEEGKIEMHCDYCGNDYRFDKIDVEHLRHQMVTPPLDS